jgi:formylglycine-generating enzyme required for sulfatase activity
MGTPESELDELVKLGADRDWIENEVPQHEVTLEKYTIARYPVTNAEFGRFIQDGGYENPDYWTEAGWKQKERMDWTQPRYWEDKKWNAHSHPVVGVSWYEALAYCRWLSAKSGCHYRLPSEAQWEKAARGTGARRYPWGNDWAPDRCNNKETGPGRTTPVGQYPEGNSPYGVSEMVGQVWEWCIDKYNETESDLGSDTQSHYLEGQDSRILRGGSWNENKPASTLRCSYRNWSNPMVRQNFRGLRCVCILEPEV